jgi:hypothetical protein
VRVCVQCGLSIGESATFCQVCGTRAGNGDATAVAVATVAPLRAVVTEPGAVDPEFAAQLDAVPVTGHSSLLDAEPETDSAQLVADLAAEHEAGSAAALGPDAVVAEATDVEQAATVDAPEAEAPVDAEAAELEAAEPAAVVEGPEPDEPVIVEAAEAGESVVIDEPVVVEGPEADELVIVDEPVVIDEPVVAEQPATAEDEPAEPVEEPEEAAPAEQPEAAESPADEPEEAQAAEDTLAEPADDARERKMAEIAALLEFGSRCEEANPSRAAVVYGEVVVGCLEVSDDPLASEPVRRDLVQGFDRLSFVLERQGLPEEALAVVDDAVALGLLDGEDAMSPPQIGALRDRRENLRRLLYGDSAQL